MKVQVVDATMVGVTSPKGNTTNQHVRHRVVSLIDGGHLTSLQGVELLTCCCESILPRGMERDVCDGLDLALECVHDLAGL